MDLTVTVALGIEMPITITSLATEVSAPVVKVDIELDCAAVTEPLRLGI